MLGLCYTGVFTKLATLSPNPMYREIAEEHFDYWQNGIRSTPGGLKYLDSWGVAKYPAAESFVQLVYYKETGEQNILILLKVKLTTFLGTTHKHVLHGWIWRQLS